MKTLINWLFKPKPQPKHRKPCPVVLFDKRDRLPPPDVKRFAVVCWDTVAQFAYSRPPSAIVNVLAATADRAQDHIRGLNAGFEAYEVRLATTSDIEQGMTLSEFRNRYNTR